MEHIDFDEIVQAVYAKKVDSEYLCLIAKINRHIQICPECKKAFTAVRDLRNFMQELEVRNCCAENKMVRVLEAIHKRGNLSLPLGRLMDAFSEKVKEKRSMIEVKIRTFREIATTNLMSDFCFYHPMQAGTMKSTNHSEAEELTDVLIDDSYNRISIGEDQTLSLRLKKDICEDGSVIFLIPDDETQPVLIGEATQSADGMCRVLFDNVALGGYSIFL